MCRFDISDVSTIAKICKNNIQFLLIILCVGRTVAIRLSRSGDYDLFLQLAVEAALDWVYYEFSDRVRLSVIPTSTSTTKIASLMASTNCYISYADAMMYSCFS